MTIPSAFSSAKSMLYTIEGKSIEFIHNEKLQLTVSKGCPEITSNQLCPHLLFLKNLKLEWPKDAKGNIGIGHIVCSKNLKGKTVLGFDSTKNKNEITFCKTDDYYIDIGTLDYYASKKLGNITENVKRIDRSKK